MRAQTVFPYNNELSRELTSIRVEIVSCENTLLELEFLCDLNVASAKLNETQINQIKHLRHKLESQRDYLRGVFDASLKFSEFLKSLYQPKFV